jgi:hypothetical protein
MSKQLTEAELQKLLSAGFEMADDEIRPRLIVSMGGIEKQGKTHFALTAPGDIVIFSLDVGLEGVVHKFTRDKRVIVHNMMNYSDPDKAKQAWSTYMQLYEMALRTPGVRTVIVDTATQLWALLRLARFGKVTQVMPYQYGPVNAEYKGMLDMGYDSDKNLILIHKLRPVYINDKRTKDLERDGFRDTGARVQVNLHVYRDEAEEEIDAEGNVTVIPGEFNAYITDCRQNERLQGLTLSGPECDFAFLAARVFPNTNIMDWS